MIKQKLFFNTLLMIYLVLFNTLCQAKANQQSEPTEQVGVATYYSDRYHGKRTASGDIYDKFKLTAVHTKYPFGTMLRVTNLQNNRSVLVKVNDRAPLRKNHLLDLSRQAAVELDFIRAGRAKVKIEAIELGRS